MTYVINTARPTYIYDIIMTIIITILDQGLGSPLRHYYLRD